MPTKEGSVAPVTYVCGICGQFMWTEGNCDPCQATEDARPKPEPKAKPQKAPAAPTAAASVKEPKPKVKK